MRLLLAVVLAAPATCAGEAGLVAADAARPASRVEYRLPDDPAELLRLDAEMRAYFAARVGRHGQLETQLDQISAAILGPAGLGFRYAPDRLYDVREAFRRREGNCFTFALLFAAVARDYRIRAVFNAVPTRPSWIRSGGIVLEVRHVNVRVDSFRATYEIDVARGDDLRPRFGTAYPIEDATAFASVYSDDGVRRLAAGDISGALAMMQRATMVAPNHITAWVNLGGAHLVEGQLAEARHCYERALQIDSGALGAINGLARVHRKAGELAEALALERKAVRYRERNPYYLLYRARLDLEEGDLESASHWLSRAYRIKRDEPEILETLIEVAERRQNEREAARWRRRLARLQASGVAGAR